MGREYSIKLRLITKIPVVSRRDWQHCSAVQTFKETVHQDGAFLHPRCLISNTYGNPHNFHGHGKINDTDIGYIPDFGRCIFPLTPQN